MFATLFHARLDGATGALSYVDAGHGLARIVRAGGGLEALNVRGIPAGAIPGSTWDEGAAQLGPGDGLVVFSDGILDQRAVDAELSEAMATCPTADAVADRLVAPARASYREDDVTVVVVRRKA